MAWTNRADAASAWRDPARYHRLLGFDRATWAWECLRRSLDREPVGLQRLTWTMLRADPPLCLLTVGACDAVKVLPLDSIDALADFAGHVFWCSDLHAPVLVVDAIPVECDEADAFCLRDLPHSIVVLRHRGVCEHVLIADGPRCIRIEVRKGTLLEGPVRLDFALCADRHVEAKILMLRRLTGLCRLGRFPVTLFPPERRARRWAMALQAWDGRQAGASQRDIARVLHGDHAVHDDWNGQSDYLRTHIRRLLRTADGLIGGGWRKLLR